MPVGAVAGARSPSPGTVMLGMPIDIAVPPQNATFEARGEALRVVGAPSGPFEVRVDAGLVFARFLSREPRTWNDVTLPSVLAWFEAGSPIATFIRQHGAHPLRQLLFDGAVDGLVDAAPTE
ncbi:hypothetical protein [Gemmatimonas sp.]|uniref:hypothetical protein n=1 Tax=Gemmatimonas sp. TaxID=1962908 RepID=UPI0033408A65